MLGPGRQLIEKVTRHGGGGGGEMALPGRGTEWKYKPD